MKFAKKKTAILALTLVLCIGIASAALLDYYGRIVTTVNVNQAIYLDGKPYYEDIIEDFNGTEIMPSTIIFTLHYLENQAQNPITMQFNYIITNSTGHEDHKGITVTYLEDSKPYSFVKDYATERGTLHVAVEDTGDGWLQWTYTYADNPTHTPKMTVAINYPHGFCITTFDDGSHDGWYYAPDVGTTVRFADYSGGTYEDWVKTSVSGENGNVLSVAIKKTRLPNEFLWHGYANYNGIPVWIEIDENYLPIGHATIREPISSPFTLAPGERLDFYIRYEFDEALEPGEYTIITKVVTPATPPKYTTGLTVKFKIYDTATYALLDTGDVSPEFYVAGVDPIGTRTFATKPVAVAAYDSTLGAWTVSLDAGTYVVLIKKDTTVIYPEVFTVTVPGTNSEDKEVWLEPSTLNVYEKASVTITTALLAYNATSGAYDVSVSNMNTTLYDKWLVTLMFTVSGTDKIIKAGRIYQTKISGLVPEEYSLDGAVKTTVLEDTDASDDGVTGYYCEFEEWEGGEIHRLDLYFNDYGATGISGTITVKLFQYYECLNTNLRWWTDQTSTISVVN